MSTYTLFVTNQSSMPGQFAVYQKQPDVLATGAFSLAWFTKGAHQNTAAKFTWTIDYDFVWSEVANVAPGVVCLASQTLSTDLNINNSITFDKDDNGFYFKAQTTDAQHAGSLIINETGLIPSNNAAVGIGMSGFGTFVWPSQPNIPINITPHPEYWIAYGNYQHQEVLDVQRMTFPQQIVYPSNKYTATLTLQSDNTWTPVTYS